MVATGAVRHAKLHSNTHHRNKPTQFLYRPDAVCVNRTNNARTPTGRQTVCESVKIEQRDRCDKRFVNTDVCEETRGCSDETKPCVSSLPSGRGDGGGGGVATRREAEAETRRREIAAAELRRRRWKDGGQRGDDDSFNRPDTPPLPTAHQPSPPASLFALPADSVILRHRRRRAHAAAGVAPLDTSSSSSSSSSSSAGDGDDETDDRHTAAKHHRVTERCRYAGRAKRAACNINNRSVPL